MKKQISKKRDIQLLKPDEIFSIHRDDYSTLTIEPLNSEQALQLGMKSKNIWNNRLQKQPRKESVNVIVDDLDYDAEQDSGCDLPL